MRHRRLSATLVACLTALAVAAGCSSGGGPSSGCQMDANGCTCSPGTSTIDCGRNQIPTDPANFRQDLFFVTPCCQTDAWPQSGSCTCEDRVGVSCFDNSDGSCQCGSPGGNLNGSTVEPSPSGTLSSCTAPAGGMCCAIPGPQPDGPQLTCICFPTSSPGGCADVTLSSNGASAGAVPVDHCDGSNVLTTTCPTGTSQTGTCGSASSGGSSGGSSSGGSKPECSSDGDCSSKCSNDCYQCLYGSCSCGSEDSYGVCTF